MNERATFTSVIKHRGFLNLWINQILVQLAFNSLNFALIIWVFRLTDSNIAVSVLLFAVYLPSVILGLFSGVLVDIIDRKKIIIFIDLFLCLCFFSLIIFKESYFAVLVITFLVNSFGQLYGPAEASAIPIIVKRNQLIVANSLFSATMYSTFLLGFGISGPLINHLGINFVFGLGGLLLAIAFLLSLAFPSIKGAMDERSKKLVVALRNWDYQDIKEIGLGEIGQTLKLIKGKLSILSSIFIMAGVQVVIGIIAVLAPGFLEKSLHINAADASYIVVVPLGIGIIVGGFIIAKLGHKIIRRILVSWAIIFGGLLFFLEGISPVISPAIRYFHRPKPLSFITQPSLSTVLAVGSFLLGIAMVSILIPLQTVLQENTPEEDRGKVFSVLGIAMAGLSIIPILLSGLLADIFGTTPIFIGMGVVIMLIGLFGLNPNLFFKREWLSFKLRQFLGLGHWEKKG